MTRAGIDDDSVLLVHAYLDGELDPANALAIEKRMAADPALAAEQARVEALQSLMRRHLPCEAPPAGLRSRVESAVGMERARAPLAARQFSWRTLAACIAVTAVVASAATSMLKVPAPAHGVRDGIVDAHIRSLMAVQPIDVASSDRHTVKPWFNGRIPQSPRVVDLARQDFPLVGGRIDVVGGVPVPTLVYGHGKHLISLTAVPEPGGANSAPVPNAASGYNMVHWTEDGVVYWAVSDVASGDLDRFVALFRAAAPEQ